MFFLVAKLITSVITQARYIKVRAGTYLKIQTKQKIRKRLQSSLPCKSPFLKECVCL